jgi:hypothetical protein
VSKSSQVTRKEHNLSWEIRRKAEEKKRENRLKRNARRQANRNQVKEEESE